jgi:hypothetical protein
MVPSARIEIVDCLERYCMNWDNGWIGKVPGVLNAVWLYPVCGMGMWMAWKGTSCMEWECGWFGR